LVVFTSTPQVTPCILSLATPQIQPRLAGKLGFAFIGTTGTSVRGRSFISLFAHTLTSCALSCHSQIVGINPDGTERFVTAPIAGVAAGTPVSSADGTEIMTTHNVDGQTGSFTVFNTADTTNPAFTYSSADSPFGAVGYFHNPVQGYFEGGEGNTNDVFMWMYNTAGSTDTVGDGQMFAYQKPLSSGNATLEVNLVGGTRDYQSPNPPIFTNQGLSMYWAVTAASQRCWIGDGLARNNFDGNHAESQGFDRGDPRYIASRAPPTLSSDPAQPVVYGPGAAAQVWRMNFDFSERTEIATTAVVSAKVVISPDEQYVYYATQDGNLYQLDADDLTESWTQIVGDGVTPTSIAGEMAQHPTGGWIYLADTVGEIRAYQVANAAPTAPVTPTFPPLPVNDTAPPVVPTTSPPSTVPVEMNATVPPTPTMMPNLTMPPTPTMVPNVTMAPNITVSPGPTATPAPSVEMTTVSPTTTPGPTTTMNATEMPTALATTDFPSETPVPAPVAVPVAFPVAPPPTAPEPTSAAAAFFRTTLGALFVGLAALYM
jgi:hypothetical protein